MYLTYDEYQDMGGALASPAFDRFLFSAETQIDKWTHGRIVGETPVRQSVKMLAFELVEHLSRVTDKAEYKSASNTGISVTYASVQERGSWVKGLATAYLDQETIDGVALLYAGVEA